MAFNRIDRVVTLDVLIAQTFACIKRSPAAVGIYLLVFTILGVIGDMLETEKLEGASAAMRIGAGIAGIIGGYLLLQAMVAAVGQLTSDGRRRYLAYFGQAILLALGVMAGFILLIIPGVIIACRWVMAPVLLVGRGDGAVEGLGRSWELTRGHALTIFLASLVTGLIMIIPIVVVGVAVALVPGAEEGIGAIGGSIGVNLIASLYTVLSSAMAVALLVLIDPGVHEMEDVFA